jgi:uncharacterized membrane protein AbrB (regulator of aidB expression)
MMMMIIIIIIIIIIGTSGGLLFHKILGISREAAQFAASQEGLSSMSE